MSDYTVVSAVSETLRNLVWSIVQHETEISFMLGDDQENICLDPPFLLLGEIIDPEILVIDLPPLHGSGKLRIEKCVP